MLRITESGNVEVIDRAGDAFLLNGELVQALLEDRPVVILIAESEEMADALGGAIRLLRANSQGGLH